MWKVKYIEGIEGREIKEAHCDIVDLSVSPGWIVLTKRTTLQKEYDQTTGILWWKKTQTITETVNQKTPIGMVPEKSVLSIMEAECDSYPYPAETAGK